MEGVDFFKKSIGRCCESVSNGDGEIREREWRGDGDAEERKERGGGTKNSSRGESSRGRGTTRVVGGRRGNECRTFFTRGEFRGGAVVAA